MSMFDAVRNVFKRSQGRPCRPRRSNHHRPELIQLEERVVPSITITQLCADNLTTNNTTAGASVTVGTDLVTKNQAQLKVQASDSPNSNLTCAWTLTSAPTGTNNPNLLNNPTSNQTNANFNLAGSYVFTVTVTDGAVADTVTGTATVTVTQTASNVGVTPATVSVQQGAQQTFTAAAVDQFGNPMSSQPSFTWQVSGGTLSSTTGSSVTFTAGSPGNGQVKVSASSGNAQANITVTPTPAVPVVTQAASAQSSTITGTGTSLQVKASDPDGANPTFTWSYSGPTGATFNSNGTSNASQPNVTFTQAGTYAFTVTIADALDAALTATSGPVTVTVVQTPSNNLSITPANVTLLGGQTQQFTVAAVDQFGNAITSALSGTWQVNGVGSMSSTTAGLYIANGGAGSAQIKFSASSGANAQANVSVTAPPAAPSNLQASVQNGQVKLQWNTNSNNETYFVVLYYPCCIPNPSWTTLFMVQSTNNNYTFTPTGNQVPSAEYEVEEGNAVGPSAPSNYVTITTPAAAPTGLSATASKGQASLSWTASTGAATYDIYRATSSGKEGNTPIATGVTGATYTDSNVTGGTTYYYEVTAIDAAGQSPMSSEVSATPPQVPAAPTGLTASAGLTNISLSWNAVNGASSYNIYRSTSSGAEGSTPYQTGLTATSFNDTNVVAFTTYFYQVSAVNTNTGEGAMSTEVSATPGNDWFSNNLPDSGLQTLARTDFNRDGSITYNDMLGLLTQAVTETGTGTVSTAVVTSLQALASSSGAAYLNMLPSLQGLAYNLADGGQFAYQGTTLNGLKANSTTAAQLQVMVNKWFLGEDLPTIDTQYWGTSGYVLANDGTLFGSSGAPQAGHDVNGTLSGPWDVYQGEEGDCWLMASFEEIAYKQPSIIENSFTDDGLVLENGVQVNVWTYRYYSGSTPQYMTVNNYFPSNNGVFMYANFEQTIANTSNVLWAPLMEKAYAGLYGDNYADLNGGWAQNVLPTETGGSSANINFSSQSSYISAINNPTDLMTVGSWSNSNGFVADHDYAVLWVNSNGTIQTFNPWGTDEPPPITYAYLTGSGNFTEDGDTVVSALPALQAGQAARVAELARFAEQLSLARLAWAHKATPPSV